MAGIIKIKIGKKIAEVSEIIAPKILRANKAFFEKTGKNIDIVQSYRSAADQAALYAKLKAINKNIQVAPPGKSFHEKGLAIDVWNWKEAEPFLRAEGLKNDLENDKNHFSFGEFGTLRKIKKSNSSIFFISLLAIGAIYFYRKYIL